MCIDNKVTRYFGKICFAIIRWWIVREREKRENLKREMEQWEETERERNKGKGTIGSGEKEA